MTTTRLSNQGAGSFIDVEEVYLQARALDHWAHQKVFENAKEHRFSVSVFDLARMRDWRDHFEAFLKSDMLAPLDKRVAWVQHALKDVLKSHKQGVPSIELVMIKAQEVSIADPSIVGVMLKHSFQFNSKDMEKALKDIQLSEENDLEEMFDDASFMDLAPSTPSNTSKEKARPLSPQALLSKRKESMQRRVQELLAQKQKNVTFNGKNYTNLSPENKKRVEQELMNVLNLMSETKISDRSKKRKKSDPWSAIVKPYKPPKNSKSML